MANIEVEIRGLLTKQKFDELNKLFAKEGEFKYDKERILVCYPDPETGSLVEECRTDIRVRTTNGVPEIIIKQGEWGGRDESRRELSLMGQKGDFDKMIQMLAALGHKHGILAVRKGIVYEYKDVEFSLVEVPGHSYYFEAEIMVSDKFKQKAATEKINQICEKLGLKPQSQKEFFDYVNKLNTEANGTFDFNNYAEGYFKQRFGI